MKKNRKRLIILNALNQTETKYNVEIVYLIFEIVLQLKSFCANELPENVQF